MKNQGLFHKPNEVRFANWCRRRDSRAVGRMAGKMIHKLRDVAGCPSSFCVIGNCASQVEDEVDKGLPGVVR